MSEYQTRQMRYSSCWGDGSFPKDWVTCFKWNVCGWTKFHEDSVYFLLNISSWFLSSFLLLLFSCSVLSSCLWPHELQHAKLPCPSLSPRVCSNSCPLSQWCYLTIYLCSLLLLPSFFPASGSFPVSWLFPSGGPSIEASVSVLPMNIQGWFPIGLTGLISLQSKGLSRVFSSTTGQKHQFFGAQPYGPALTSVHEYWKNHSYDYMDICWQNDVSAFQYAI